MSGLSNLAEEVEWTSDEMLAGGEDRREDRLVMCAGVDSVAATGLAIHDLDVGQAAEFEELRNMAFQVFGQAFVIRVGSAEAGQHTQFCREFLHQFGRPNPRLFPFPDLVASGQHVLEQLDHGVWEGPRAAEAFRSLKPDERAELLNFLGNLAAPNDGSVRMPRSFGGGGAGGSGSGFFRSISESASGGGRRWFGR